MKFVTKVIEIVPRIIDKLDRIILGSKLKKVGGGIVRYRNIRASFKENIVIGDSVSIGHGVSLGASTYGSITVGDRTAIAEGTRVVTATHDYNVLPISRVGINKSIYIGKDVWIGTAAIILPGVKLNDGCVVAAGAVVTKDVPMNCVVAGVPARVLKELESRELRLGK